MTAANSNAAPTTSPGGGYEKRDVRFRSLVVAGAIFVLSWALAFVLAWFVFRYFAQREARLSPPPNVLEQMYGREAPPQPRLQSNPRQDLLEMRAEQDAVLNSYGWVDRRAGIVHIPIGRAIELLAQRGLPSRPEAGQPAAVAPGTGQATGEAPASVPPAAGGAP